MKTKVNASSSTNSFDLQQIFNALVGQKLEDAYLYTALNDPFRPYRNEVDIEIDAIDSSESGSHGRSYNQIIKACESGKIAEIILREDAVGSALFEKATKRYHDLYFPKGECFVEVKRWKQNSIPQNVEKFLREDSKKYNTSKWLFVFTYDDKHTWLDRIIDVESETKTDEVGNSDVVIDIHQTRNSYTIYMPTYRHLKATDGVICFISSAGKKTYKTFDWFDDVKRESNKGAASGGYYVFADKV